MNEFIIPDIVLYDTLNNVLNALRANYKANQSTPQKSLLYTLVKTLKLERYILFDQIVELLITTRESLKHIVVKTSFDRASRDRVQVYITMPSESTKDNSLTMGQGDQEENIIFTDDPTPVPVSVQANLNRRFECTYFVVITSDNKNEVWLLYHVLRAFLIAAQVHLELSGIQNVKFGGQDLAYNDVVPENTYARAITIGFEYTQVVPDFFSTDIIGKIEFEGEPYIEDETIL